MTILRLATVLQVDDLATAAAEWHALLGTPPTFVDGDRWAQFDLAGGRLALAGADRTDMPGVMMRVDDLYAHHARLCGMGRAPSPIVEGAHERRFGLTMPSNAIAIFYQPL